MKADDFYLRVDPNTDTSLYASPIYVSVGDWGKHSITGNTRTTTTGGTSNATYTVGYYQT